MLENSCLENTILIAKMAFIPNMIFFFSPSAIYSLCSLYARNGQQGVERGECSTAVSSLSRVHIKWDYSGNLNTLHGLKSNVCP